MNNTAIDMTHLNALQLRLSHERGRLDRAGTKSERDLRAVWVKQCEKEIEGEYKFLGITPETVDEDLSDEELLAALFSE